MLVTRCQTCHMENPMGFAFDTPRFSWVTEGVAVQKALQYRLRIALSENLEAPCFDTGFAALDPLGYTAGIALAPRTRYYWTVTARDESGMEAESAVQWFETGKRDEPWSAQWITCDRDEPRHPVFTKELPAIKDPRSARLYICGLGLYEAYIGNRRVGEEYLTPYCNDYSSWLQAQVYDVTELLQASGQTLAVTLGNGWYKARFGFDVKKTEGTYGNDWRLIAELRVTDAQGIEHVLGTDGSWRVHRCGLTFSNIYDGEIFDAALVDTVPVPATVCADEPKLPVDRYSLPVLIQERRKPVELLVTPKGETVLDLGQNLTGSFRLRVNIPAGQRVYLQFGEVLQDDCFYRDNLRSALAEYTYLSDGTERELQPRFTFYGYRYVKIEGIDNLKPEDFTALVLFSDLPEAGYIATGHALVNKLISNVGWGLRGNFLDVPTDCPQRDERMGWTGDAQVFAATASFLRDTYAFYRKYLFDIGCEQVKRGGAVPYVVPSFNMPGAATVWGDATTIIPWNMYLFYGDTSILAEHYDHMKSWVDYITKLDGETHHWREVFHFGDWLALDNPSGKVDEVMGGTDVGLIADVYYMYSAQLVSKAAAILGRDDDAQIYTKLADRVLADIRQEYFTPAGRCAVDTQTAHVLALRYKLWPDDSRARESLIRTIKARGGKLATGFVGTPLLAPALCEAGLSEIAYDLLLNEEYPGWLYSVKLGATTIWERWNSIEADGSISSTGMNSLNHYAYGSIAEFLYRYGAGLNPIEEAPGFRRIRLTPLPDYRLGHLEAEYASAAGLWRSRWTVTGERHAAFAFTVPYGCEAELVLPQAPEQLAWGGAAPERLACGAWRLAAGDYTVEYDAIDRLGGPYEYNKGPSAFTE